MIYVVKMCSVALMLILITFEKKQNRLKTSSTILCKHIYTVQNEASTKTGIFSFTGEIPALFLKGGLNKWTLPGHPAADFCKASCMPWCSAGSEPEFYLAIVNIYCIKN